MSKGLVRKAVHLVDSDDDEDRAKQLNGKLKPLSISLDALIEMLLICLSCSSKCVWLLTSQPFVEFIIDV